MQISLGIMKITDLNIIEGNEDGAREIIATLENHDLRDAEPWYFFAEIYGLNKAVIGDSPVLDPFGLALFEHAYQVVVIHLEGDMQIIIVLLLELEGMSRGLEKCQE